MAWVIVEACRDSIRRRHRGVKETLIPSVVGRVFHHPQ
jgi:hypothetical protein